MKISILFIINLFPVVKKGQILKPDKQLIDADKFNIEIALTQYKGRTYYSRGSREPRRANYRGGWGDGTINEINRLSLFESKLANFTYRLRDSLARHLKLHRVDNAIKFINDNADKAELLMEKSQ